MPDDTVLDTLQRSIVLIGSASNYIPQVRHTTSEEARCLNPAIKG